MNCTLVGAYARWSAAPDTASDGMSEPKRRDIHGVYARSGNGAAQFATQAATLAQHLLLSSANVRLGFRPV